MPKADAVSRKENDTPLPLFPHGAVPAWEIAYLFPPQGAWSESEYWRLENQCEGAAAVELLNGYLVVLPRPTILHHMILMHFLDSLHEFVRAHAPGVVLPYGLKLRLRKNLIRNPDGIYMKAENAHRRHKQYWDGADLVMEVVSEDPKDHKRDWEDKPKDYARAGIPEYWIIDPQQQVIRVLTLKGKSYRVHGDFGPGTQATSVLLPGFAVAVDEALAPPGSDRTE